MDKSKEIKLLTQLCADGTYFSEYFKRDLTQMSLNIQNDCPIEFNTYFGLTEDKLREYQEDNEVLNAKVTDLESSLNDYHDEIIAQSTANVSLLKALLYVDNEAVQNILSKTFSTDQIVREKLRMDPSLLTSAECSWIRNNLKS